MFSLPTILQKLSDIEGRPSLVEKARAINDTYTTFMPDATVWHMVLTVFPPEVYPAIVELSQGLPGHHFVNELLLRYYPAERVVKYHVVRERIDEPDEVTVFEMYVDSSRVDVARINGESYAIEVKTEFDRLDKLSRQVEDYAKVFEHVMVIAHESHVERVLGLIPEYCGIQAYAAAQDQLQFSTIRTVAKNPLLAAEAQVRNLSSRDLSVILRQAGLQDPKNKKERAELVLRECHSDTINQLFKDTIKLKYRQRWAHVQANFARIEPVDVQAFYRAQADPDWVYYKYSSIV